MRDGLYFSGEKESVGIGWEFFLKFLLIFVFKWDVLGYREWFCSIVV